MTKKVSRRTLLHGVVAGSALGGVALAVNRFPGTIRNLYDVADALNYSVHDLLLRGQPLVREFSRSSVTLDFPTSGVTSPNSVSLNLGSSHGSTTPWNLSQFAVV